MRVVHFFLLSIIGTGLVNADIPKEIIDWSLRNVWNVGVKSGTGSGFFISSETMITACHVVDEAEYINGKALVFIRNERDTRLIQMKIEVCDGDRDIAILSKVKNQKDTFKTLPTEIVNIPPRGTKVWGPGYPLGLPLVITEGHLQQLLPDSPKRGGHLITAPTIMGDSGSPVLILKDGKVKIIGIRLAIRGIPQGYGFRRFNSYLPHLTVMGSGEIIQQVILDGTKHH